ncbi:MAG: hypothetical protein WAZ19_11725 [Anaerolineae bacterium]
MSGIVVHSVSLDLAASAGANHSRATLRSSIVQTGLRDFQTLSMITNSSCREIIRCQYIAIFNKPPNRTRSKSSQTKKAQTNWSALGKIFER